MNDHQYTTNQSFTDDSILYNEDVTIESNENNPDSTLV